VTTGDRHHPRGSDRTRAILICVGLALVWAVAARWYVGIGFNPTDDGLITAQSARILHGASPHVEIVSPRPLGSPLLHLVDLALPTPLLATSRAIALLEFLAMAGLGVRLVTRRAVGTWGPFEVALSLVAFLVNLHTFPLLSWHTVDGLLVSTAAFVLFDKAFTAGSTRWLRSAALLAGFAPLIKQSFAPVPLIAIVWIVWTVRAGRSPFPRATLIKNLLWGVVPGVAYVAWLLATSSLSAAIDQLASASGISAFAGLVITVPSVVALTVVAVLVWAVVVGRRRDPTAPDSARLTLALQVMGAALMAMALGATFTGQLRYTDPWGAVLWWAAAMAVCLWSVAHRSIDIAGLAALALGWMASLSWGYPLPSLFGGVLLAVTLSRGVMLIDAGLLPDRRAILARAGTVLVVLVLIGLVPLAVSARESTVYRDVPADRSVALGSLSRELRGVRASKTTARYLAQIKQCADDHPATNLAVLPDNAAVPLLLGHRNPLPLAWWYPLEIPTDRDQVIAEIERVDRAGDYLVLFQTVDVQDLAKRRSLPDATANTRPFDYEHGMASEVFDALNGQVVTCGSFVGRYSP